jgi:hypothetical protein
MDSSTEFLFGLSANTQICAMVRDGKMDAKPHIVDMDGFEGAFKRVQTHVGVRMKVSATPAVGLPVLLSSKQRK